MRRRADPYQPAPDLADRPAPSDHGQRPLVEVAKRRRAPAPPRLIASATWRACWIATVARPGRGRSSSWVIGHVADTEISG